MSDVSRVESVGQAMRVESMDTTARASINIGDTEYVGNQVLKTAEQKGAQEAVRVSEISEVPQDSIDALSAQITDPAVKSEIEKHLGMLKTYIEKGNFRGNKTEFMTQIQKAINEYPPLRDAFGGNTVDLKAYAEWMLTNQKGTLSSEMYQRLEELFKKKPPVDTTEMKRLDADRTKKEADEGVAKSERDAADEKQKKCQEKVDDFSDPSKAGSKAEKLQTATNKEPQRKTRYETAKKDEEDAQAHLDKLKRELEQTQKYGSESARRGLAAIDSDLLITTTNIDTLEKKTRRTPAEDTQLATEKQKLVDLRSERAMSQRHGASSGRRELSQIESDLSAAKSELAQKRNDRETAETAYKEKAQLEAEKKKVEEDLADAKQTYQNAEAKLTKATADWDTADTAYKEAERKYKAWEKDILSRSERVISESTASWINNEADRLEKAFDSYNKDVIEKERDENKRKMKAKTEELITEYRDRTDPKKGRVTNKSESAKYANILLTGGPDALLKAINTEGSLGLTPEQINEYLGDQAMKNEIITNVLGRHIGKNGISEAQIEMITRSDWGEGMIQAALKKNESVKAQVEAALGAGVLEGGFWKKFGRAVVKRRWLLLLILFGVASAGMAAIGPLGALGGAGAAAGAEGIWAADRTI